MKPDMKNKIFFRALASVLALCLILTASACSRKQKETSPKPADTPAPAAAAEKEPEPDNPDTDTAPEDGTTAGSEAAPPSDSEPDTSEEPEDDFPLPDDTGEFSIDLAQRLLSLCTGHSRDGEAAVLEAAGFEIVKQEHYDKTVQDPSHTCAYTVGERQVKFNGQTRPVILIAIRGTVGGEWYSNFDFAPSHAADTAFAENFLKCAQDVYDGTADEIDALEDPVIIICGHSRGAACANLLGMLVNCDYPADSTFVYTFATPATFRGDDGEFECGNIFNVINPCDAVTYVPLSVWGYYRPGTDVVLSGDADVKSRLENAAAMLGGLSPTIPSYYEDRHSLTGPGLAEDGVGLTTYELMTALCAGLTDEGGMGAALSGGFSLPGMENISPDSDFAPLFGLVGQVSSGDGTSSMKVLEEHMPSTYQALLAARAALSGNH